MSTEPQSPFGTPVLSYVEAQTGRTVRAQTAIRTAQSASLSASARPAKRCQIHSAYPDGTSPRTYCVSYTRTTDAVAFLYVAAHYRAATTADALTLDMTIRDGLGNAITSGSALTPYFLKGTTVSLAGSTGSIVSDARELGSGYLDLDALAVSLVDPDWSLEFTVAAPTGTDSLVDLIEFWEVGRQVVDQDDDSGVLVGPLMPGNPITSGPISGATADGWARIEATVQGAVKSQRTYAQECFGPDDVTATLLPQTTSAAYVALTNLEESAGVPIAYTFRVRTVVGGTGGERARARFRYIAAGGANGSIELTTGIAAYSLTGLSSTSWTWSPWLDVLLKANAAGHLEVVSFKAKQGGAGVLYVSSWVLDEDAA